jgi:hypothetical protein
MLPPSPVAIPAARSAVASVRICSQCGSTSERRAATRRPLSTLRPCRIRDGIRSSVTTAWPSAASVQASMIERTSASRRLTPGSTPTPTSVPATIVSGRPIPSRRAGTANSRCSAGNEIREASAKRTSVSVASASSFTGSPPMRRSIRPSRGSASRPAEVKKIAAVTTERSNQRETAENASRTNAIVASSQAPSSSPPLHRNRD